MEGKGIGPIDVSPELGVLFENTRGRCVAFLAARPLLRQFANGGNAVLPELKEQGGQAATEQLRSFISVTCQHHPPTRRTLVSGELA